MLFRGVMMNGSTGGVFKGGGEINKSRPSERTPSTMPLATKARASFYDV
jgi:hypothetical protein